MNNIKRTILIAAGFVFTALGAIGAFLPVMPSIPFFIIASVCFSKSSKKFHDMLINNRIVGPHIKRYHENNGITLKNKILLIIFQWLCLLGTSILFVHKFYGRVLMVIIAVVVTIYIISLKTAE